MPKHYKWGTINPSASTLIGNTKNKPLNFDLIFASSLLILFSSDSLDLPDESTRKCFNKLDSSIILHFIVYTTHNRNISDCKIVHYKRFILTIPDVWYKNRKSPHSFPFHGRHFDSLFNTKFKMKLAGFVLSPAAI